MEPENDNTDGVPPGPPDQDNSQVDGSAGVEIAIQPPDNVEPSNSLTLALEDALTPIEVTVGQDVRGILDDILAAIQPSDLNPWFDITKQFLISFVGAGLAFGFALWLASRQRKAATTEALINEFSSREMLKSRFTTVGVADKVTSGTLSLADVAMSSLQGVPKPFAGEVVDGLTEHQHVSHVIGYYRRLALALRYKWINRTQLTHTIGGSFGWTLPFLLELADEVERVANENPTGSPLSERAAWVYAVRYVDSKVKPIEFIPIENLPR